MSFSGFVEGQLSLDPAKVEAEWPTLTSWKQLQCFLGFANFYQQFIHYYSRVAAPRSSSPPLAPSPGCQTLLFSDVFTTENKPFITIFKIEMTIFKVNFE